MPLVHRNKIQTLLRLGALIGSSVSVAKTVRRSVYGIRILVLLCHHSNMLIVFLHCFTLILFMYLRFVAISKLLTIAHTHADLPYKHAQFSVAGTNLVVKHCDLIVINGLPYIRFI